MYKQEYPLWAECFDTKFAERVFMKQKRTDGWKENSKDKQDHYK